MSAVEAKGRPIAPRGVFVAAVAVAIALVAAGIAEALVTLIDVVTNIAFYGRFSLQHATPADAHIGKLVFVVPVIGALLVGVIARFGSSAIRGHGIPEAMERVLEHQSRIPARLTLLKPIASAIAIGTGGPFGAEGPIIATGSALGSLVGQLLRSTESERRALLAAGAAAGMSATFGSPVSAVLLAIELLLFELHPRSLVPVALAAATANAVRIGFNGSAAVFPMSAIGTTHGPALAAYAAIGAVVGVASVVLTNAVYDVEELFERLPIHWMWWPALGAVAVGAAGAIEPHALGVGYDNIERVVSGDLAGKALAVLVVAKLVAWVVSLASGTSGGTLAPLFTLGGGLGALLGAALAATLPSFGIDPRVAALVGMAAMFAGASRALLTSIVFAFETTRQPLGLLPLVAGCTVAYLVSGLLMEHSIMTRKLAFRGVRVPASFAADAFDRVPALRFATRDVVALAGEQSVASARAFLLGDEAAGRHQGYPVLDDGRLVGVVTRREIVRAEGGSVRDLVKREPIVARETATLRDAIDTIVREGVGRLPVVAADDASKVIAMLTRTDILAAYGRSFDDERVVLPSRWKGFRRRRA